MSDRLEEIKEELVMNVKLKIEDVNWLIQQAKRVEELEEEIKTHAPNGRNYTNEQYIGLLQENQRYKQALEEIKHELDVSHYSNYRTKAFRKRLFDTADNALRGESE